MSVKADSSAGLESRYTCFRGCEVSALTQRGGTYRPREQQMLAPARALMSPP